MINLPIFRPASPWSQGSILLRTPDGKLFPYMPFSNQQTSVITIMIAEPRYKYFNRKVPQKYLLMSIAKADIFCGVRFNKKLNFSAKKKFME